MQLGTLWLGSLGVTGMVAALKIEGAKLIRMNPRVPEGIPDGSHNLFPRTRCHKDEDACGPGCCSSKGTCAIIGADQFECIVCEDPDLSICGGECCK